MRNRWTSASLIGGVSVSSIALDKQSIASVKKTLISEFPDILSSHLSEALAAALGYKTHASLLADLKQFDSDPPIELLAADRFDQRLQELGYPEDPEFSFDLLSIDGAISTFDPRGWDIEYLRPRHKAWRNLIVLAINAGIEQKLFSLRPGDNRWRKVNSNGTLYDFSLPNGWAARGYVADIGHSELSIHAAVNPKGDNVRGIFAGFGAGDAYAAAWLERERGAWIQTSETEFNCRQALLHELADIEVDPKGFGDRGKVIF